MIKWLFHWEYTLFSDKPVWYFHTQWGFGMVESIVAITHGYRGSPGVILGRKPLGRPLGKSPIMFKVQKTDLLGICRGDPSMYIYIYYYIYILIYIYIYIVCCIREKTDITIATIFPNIKVIQDQHLPCQKPPKNGQNPLGPDQKNRQLN